MTKKNDNFQIKKVLNWIFEKSTIFLDTSIDASRGSATGRVTRPRNFRRRVSKPGFFWPGEKFYFEPGTRLGFETQPGNRPGPDFLATQNPVRNPDSQFFNPETGQEKAGPLPSPNWDILQILINRNLLKNTPRSFQNHCIERLEALSVLVGPYEKSWRIWRPLKLNIYPWP